MTKPLRHNNRSRLKEKMILSAEMGDNKALAYILDQLGGVNVVDKHKDSALMVACEFGRVKTVEFLLGEGANPHLVNKNGDTALHLAVSFIATPGCIKALLKSGACVDVKNNQGQTPLILGVSRITENQNPERCDYLQHLVDHGASMIATDNKGQSAAQLIKDHIEIFQSIQLIQHATCALDKILLTQSVSSEIDQVSRSQSRKI